jgi:hypothetical protein
MEACFKELGPNRFPVSGFPSLSLLLGPTIIEAKAAAIRALTFVGPGKNVKNRKNGFCHLFFSGKILHQRAGGRSTRGTLAVQVNPLIEKEVVLCLITV